MMQPQPETRIKQILTGLYGEGTAGEIFTRVHNLMVGFQKRHSHRYPPPVDQRDTYLITYADQFIQEGEPPLQTLAKFGSDYLKDMIRGIHILPFFPYTSDDGFSISDYSRVNPSLGTWQDIEEIAREFRLMVDAVINHCSIRHPWFQEYLHGNPKYRNYFISIPPETDLSSVIRPRTLPLLTSFVTPTGRECVWTTFSADQVDLNFKNPEVLLDIIAILLDYLGHGAQMIRLDAIAFLWKEPGTSCLHLPQTHLIIQLLRAVFDEVAPYVSLVTETNVPHRDNIAYFGNGENEARLVYNFALPPLVMHAVQKQDARVLTAWAAGLKLPSRDTAFFNFLASHDGIGLNPARGILDEKEIEDLVRIAGELGGQVSYKNNPDGTQSAYELNINYFDALGDPANLISDDMHLNRFIAAQAVMLALQGVPGIYVHSLLGSRGWIEGFELTGQKRSINRQKFQAARVRAELEDPATLRSRVFQAFRALLGARSASPAFHPAGSMEVINLDDRIFCLKRTSTDGESTVLCIHNLSPQPVQIRLPANSVRLFDLVSCRGINLRKNRGLEVNPYQVLWLDIIN